MFSYNNLPTYFKQNITQQGEQLSEAFLDEHQTKSIIIHDLLTPQQFMRLHEIYEPYTFKFEASPNFTHPRAHHIPGIGMDIIDSLFERYQGPQTLGIGTRFNLHDAYQHVCYKIDARDQGRLRKHLAVKEDPDLKDLLLGRTNSKFCSQGSEHCTHRAKIALLNNVYDISVSTMCKIFANHQLEIAYMALMLPDEVLYNVSEGNTNYGYRIYRSGTKHYMSFGSGAFDYGHDTKMWRDWCTKPTHTAHGVCITIERIAKVGPMTLLQITRVSLEQEIRATYFPPEPCKKIYDYTKKGYWLELYARLPFTSPDRIREYLDRSAPSFIVPSKLYDAIVKQGIVRPDENFTRQNLALHLKATTSRIIINSEVLQGGLELTADQFSALLVVAYIDAATHRQLETKVIGKILKIIKGEAFIDRFTNLVTNLVKGALPISVIFPSGPSEALAIGLKARDLLVNDHAVTTNIVGANFVERARNEPWKAWTGDGTCVQETKALLRNGDRAYSFLHDDKPNFTDEELASITIQNDHCQPVLEPDKYCDHDIGYRDYSQLNPNNFVVDQKLLIYHKYEHHPQTDRFINTRHKFDKFLQYAVPFSKYFKFLSNRTFLKFRRKRIAMLCSSPGNDVDYPAFSVNVTPHSHQEVDHYASNMSMKCYEGLNILCRQCLNKVDENILYCDLGMESADLRSLGSTQYRALLSLLATGKKFALKLQCFLKMLCLAEPYILIILDLVREHKLHFYNVGNANEAFVHNLCVTRPHLTDFYYKYDDLKYALVDKRRHLITDTTMDYTEPFMNEGFEWLYVDPPEEDPFAYQDDFENVFTVDPQPAPSAPPLPGTIYPFTANDLIATNKGKPIFKSNKCETPDNPGIPLQTLDKDMAIVHTDCQHDDALITDAVQKGYNVIRKQVNYCKACYLATLIHHQSYVVSGDKIVPGLRKDVPTTAFAEVKLRDEYDFPAALKILRRELLHPDAKYGEINKAALNYLKDLTFKPGKMYGVVGCPGSGKTRFAMDAIPSDCYVVTPYSRLTHEYREKGFKSGTFVKALVKRYKCVLLDEVFAFSPGMLAAWVSNADIVYMIGDPRQMGHVDEKNVYKNVLAADIIHWNALPKLNVSYTLPIDAVAVLNKHFGYDITTLSTVLHSFKNVSKKNLGDAYNCFTRAHERTGGQNVKTVAKIQGTRCDEMRLMIETNSFKLIKEAPGQFVVAISRHRNKCYYTTTVSTMLRMLEVEFDDVHTCKPKGLSSYYNEGEQFTYKKVSFTEIKTPEKFQTMVKFKREDGHVTVPEIVPAVQNPSGQALTDAIITPDETVEQIMEREGKILDAFVSAERGHSFDQVREIMNKVAPTLDAASEFYGVTTHTFDLQGAAMINNIEALANDNEHNVRRFPVPMYGRPTFINSASQSLHCIMSRYIKSNYKKKLSAVSAHRIAADMFDVILNKALVNVERISDDDLSLSFAEFVDKMVIRGRSIPLSLLDSDEQSLFASIEGFLKQQNKADVSIESWIRYENGFFKAGQGIAAQCKNINVLSAAYIRAFERKFKKCLKPNCHLVNGMSDIELSTLVRERFRDDTEHLGFDIKEFDSVHNRSTEYLMWKLYESFGVPEFVYKTIGTLNVSWILSYVIQDVNFPIKIKAKVQEKMQSGRPDTLVKNSITALAMLLLVLEGEINDVYVKGDDIYVQGRRLRLKYKEESLKVDSSEPPAFVGYIMADKLTLDIPRLCIKLLNRNYPDAKSIDDYIIAVKDWLKVIRGDQGKLHAAAINSHRYNITLGEAEYLLNFMFEFASGQIINNENVDQLVKQRLPMFVVQNDSTSF